MEVTVPLIGATSSTDSRHKLQARASEADTLAHQHIGTSTHWHINTLTHWHIDKSTHRQIVKLTHQHIHKLANFITHLLSCDYSRFILSKKLNLRFCKKNFEKILCILIIIYKFADKIPREEQ